MGHLYHGYVSHNQRVSQSLAGKPEQFLVRQYGEHSKVKISFWLDTVNRQLPGLVNIQKAVENGHLMPFIVDFPMKNGGSFHSKLLVDQRVIITNHHY